MDGWGELVKTAQLMMFQNHGSSLRDKLVQMATDRQSEAAAAGAAGAGDAPAPARRHTFNITLIDLFEEPSPEVSTEGDILYYGEATGSVDERLLGSMAIRRAALLERGGRSVPSLAWVSQAWREDLPSSGVWARAIRRYVGQTTNGLGHRGGEHATNPHGP